MLTCSVSSSIYPLIFPPILISPFAVIVRILFTELVLSELITDNSLVFEEPS
jgi:hypothetical protein